MNESKRISIFIIDDCEVDAFFTKQELNEIKDISYVTHFKRPQNALNFLLSANIEKELPDLLFLDVNMPVIDGFEFLDELAASERFEGDYPFKIIMLSNSKNLRDREKFNRESSLLGFEEKPICRINLKQYINALDLTC